MKKNIIFILLCLSTVRSNLSTSSSQCTLNKGLLKAVRTGNIEEVEELLEQGADTDIKTQFGATLLDTAMFHGYYKIMIILVEYECTGYEDSLGLDVLYTLEFGVS